MSVSTNVTKQTLSHFFVIGKKRFKGEWWSDGLYQWNANQLEGTCDKW